MLETQYSLPLGLNADILVLAVNEANDQPLNSYTMYVSESSKPNNYICL